MPSTPIDRQESLSGTVERITFHSPDSGFCVLQVKLRGRRDPVTVTGSMASVQLGEQLLARGQWENHRQHGLQFRASFLKGVPPTTLEGIERYLGSGLIKGIGQVYARKLVKAFGERVFEVIESSPDSLCEVEGIGSIRAKRIVAGWTDQKAIRDIMLFLQSHGISTARAVRIYKTYGSNALTLVSENPYRLARDIRGIGFKSADQIAAKLGIEPTSSIRARAGLSYALLEAVSKGHCALPQTELLELASELLEIPQELLQQALQQELADQEVCSDLISQQPCVFLPYLWRAEQLISARLLLLSQGAPPWPRIDAAKALPWVEQRWKIELAPSQRAAITQALESKVMVITGGPGVGKTTLVRSLLQILSAKQVRVALAAPTGRAAKRLAESTGLEAKTLHRLLEFDPASNGFKRGSTSPLDCDLLVIDETSMVDVPLMASVLLALPNHAALLIVGDVDQLPSVGPGQVLADIIGSGRIPVARLSEIFRQAASSRIITNAHRVHQGQMPEWDAPLDGTSDFYFVAAETPEEAVPKILEIVRQRIPRRFGLDPIRQIQVLCPMQRGGVGARALNVALQEALNPGRPDAPGVERFGYTYRVGDKVMQTENDYDKEVFNGDIGFVAALDPDEGELLIDFEGRSVVYGFGELDQVALCYATTIHKSQGSEYPAVVIPVMTQHYMMLARNLLYTAITRGKLLVILVGQKKAVGMAVRGVKAQLRWSKLAERLQCG